MLKRQHIILLILFLSLSIGYNTGESKDYGNTTTTLLAPVNGSTVTNGNFNISWTGRHGFSYQLQISPDKTFNTNRVNVVFPGTSSYISSTISQDTLPPDRYYWRVRAKDRQGKIGRWSKIWSFTVSSTPVKDELIPITVTVNKPVPAWFKQGEENRGVKEGKIKTQREDVTTPEISSPEPITQPQEATHRLQIEHKNPPSPFTNSPVPAWFKQGKDRTDNRGNTYIIGYTNIDSSRGSDSVTGSLSFKIELQDTPNTTTGVSLQGKTISSLIERFLKVARAIFKLHTAFAAIDCSTAGVSLVTVEIYDGNNLLLISGGPWACSLHSGSVSGVNVGSNRKVVLYGKDSSGNIKYWGEKTGITVSKDVTTPIGTILAEYVGGDTTAPTDGTLSVTAGNSEVSLSWSGFSDAGGIDRYKLVYSTTGSPNCSTGTQIYSGPGTSYTHTGLTNGGSYYYRVCCIDKAGNTSSGATNSGIPTSSGGTTTTTGTTSTTTGAWTMLKLPDTGQTTSYTATYGEDNDYTINPPSYTDNGNGTITDNVTGLMWQKEDDNTTRTWSDAGTCCDNLTLGGQSDWRLPSKKELISIVNYGAYNPSINTTYFPNTKASPYWSSTIQVADSLHAWQVDFITGHVDTNSKSNGNIYVRCVRGGGQTTTKIFTDNGNGTVTDNDTKLVWQQGEGGAMAWESALTYCEGLSLAGYNNWRLPNVKELESITDDNRYNPTINSTYFPNVYASFYYSSTTDVNYSSRWWSVWFGFGSFGRYTGNLYVRCVRGGQ